MKLARLKFDQSDLNLETTSTQSVCRQIIIEDGMDFMRSQYAESVENQMFLEDSFDFITLFQISELPEMKNELDTDVNFDIGDVLQMMEAAVNAQNFTASESAADNKMKNERIDSQTNSNTRKNTKWAIETFNKWRIAGSMYHC